MNEYFEERAAIFEYEAGFDRETAEAMALMEMEAKYEKQQEQRDTEQHSQEQS